MSGVLQLRTLSSGKLVRELPLGLGSLSGFSGSRKHSELFFSFQSFADPGALAVCWVGKQGLAAHSWLRQMVVGDAACMLEAFVQLLILACKGSSQASASSQHG